jgi:hypothetical protein
VEECSNEDTVVGPSIACPSQELNTNKELLHVQAKIKARKNDNIKLTNMAKSPTRFINHAIDPLNRDNNRPL